MKRMTPCLLIAIVLFCGIEAIQAQQIEFNNSDIGATLKNRQRALVDTLKNKNLPLDVRAAAAKNLQNCYGEIGRELLDFAKDDSNEEELRLLAVKAHTYTNDAIPSILEILASDKRANAYLNSNLLQHLAQNFGREPGNELYTNIHQTVKSLLRDERQPVRREAIFMLGTTNDPAAITIIKEGLQDEKKALVSKKVALEILNYAGPEKHVVAIRPFLNDPDPEVQRNAVFGLGIDPESQPKILELIESEDTATEVKLAGLQSLSHAYSDFPEKALSVIGDMKQDPIVRERAIHWTVATLNGGKFPVPENVQVRFAEEIEKLKDEASEAPAPLKTYCQEVIPIIEKRYPAIKSYFNKK